MTIARREFIVSSGVLALGTTMPVSAIKAKEHRRMTDDDFSTDYLLSGRNPLATSDQKLVEDRALRLIGHPEFQRARNMADQLFRWVLLPDAGDEAGAFDTFLDEYMFHYAMRAAANDPNYPTIMRFMTPPHHWFGRDVPGSRWGGDSPDFIYRVVTASHGPRYEIHGRATSEVRPTVTYSLLADRQASSVVFSTLNSVDMEFGPDGEFVITLDPSPADGRRNHIQTRPNCYAVWVRDQLGDWSTTSANALRVRRIDPPARAPMTDDELATWGANAAEDGIYYMHLLIRTSVLQQPNAMRPPAPTAALGGMPGQMSAGGRVKLAPDEALIIRTNAAGALFRNMVLTEYFWMTWDYWDRQTSLNTGQMTPDEDGRFTFVLAHRDPGVANWLDTCGRSEMRIGQRWQSFANGAPNEPLEFSGKVVKFADIERELPKGAARIDAEGRKRQLARRKAGFDRRFIDS